MAGLCLKQDDRSRNCAHRHDGTLFLADTDNRNLLSI